MKVANNKKGFTLMEVLVAVMIMVILVTIAVPMYDRAIEKSRIAEVSSVLRMLGDSKVRFLDDLDISNFRLGTDDSSTSFCLKDLDVTIPKSIEYQYSLYPSANFRNSVCARRTRGGDYAGTLFLYLGQSDDCDCSENPTDTICNAFCTQGTKMFCNGALCEDYGYDSVSFDCQITDSICTTTAAN